MEPDDATWRELYEKAVEENNKIKLNLWQNQHEPITQKIGSLIADIICFVEKHYILVLVSVYIIDLIVVDILDFILKSRRLNYGQNAFS